MIELSFLTPNEHYVIVIRNINNKYVPKSYSWDRIELRKLVSLSQLEFLGVNHIIRAVL
jgi:hypothetical protein